MSRYEIWLALGKPESIYSVWSTQTWNEYARSQNVLPWKEGMEKFDRQIFIGRHNNKFTEWLNRRFDGHSLNTQPKETSMTEKILPCAMALLRTYPGVTVETVEECENYTVQLNGKEYTVSLDATDPEEDEIGDAPMSDGFKKPKTVKDHVGILDLCLYVMASDPSIRETISDLSTDGDGSDCEAIFCYAATDYFILKVR